MKNKWLIYGAVAVGAYLIYKRMNKGNGKELAPPPVAFGKPPINVSPVSKPPVSYIKPM